MKKPLTLFLSLLFFNCFLYSQNSFISFSEETVSELKKPERIIQENGLNSVAITYRINGGSVVNKDYNSTQYQFIGIEGFEKLDFPGKPALPAHLDVIAIPLGADAKIKIISGKSRIYSNFMIHPSTDAVIDTYGAADPVFQIDEQLYATDLFYPEMPVRIIEIFYVRGMPLALIQVTPVQFNPVKKQIRVYSEINYEVTFSKGTHFIDQQNHSGEFLNNYVNYMLNPEGILSEIKVFENKGVKLTTPGSKKYIIVTHDNYLPAAKKLALWKNQLGYSTEIISSSVWTVANIKTEVKSRYQNWTPKPDYLLIMGDHQDVPAEIRLSPSDGTSGPQNFGTDLYYVCMDGLNDYVPDMAKGRISVNSLTQAFTVVDKIINYEKNPVQDTSFYTNGINCAQFQDDDLNSYDDRRFTHTSENVRDYLMPKGFTIQRIYATNTNVNPLYYNNGYFSNGQPLPNEILKSLGFQWNGSATNITNSINTGKFYVLHRDHGYSGGSGWSMPYYVTSNINSLVNGNKLPVVFSINCHTGEFTLPECFSEKFLRHPNGGAVGVFGASYFSMSGYNDGLSVGFFDAIWSNPGVVPQFGSGGVANPVLSAHNDVFTMGNVLNLGLIRMNETWAGTQYRIYQHELFHYFGDPAMKIWTKSPVPVTALYNDSIGCTASTFAISNSSCQNCIATLVADNELIGSTQLINGSGIIPVSSFSGNNVVLTISKENRKPLLDTINVIPGLMSVHHISQHLKCKGDSSGKVELKISCAPEPVKILWSTGDSIAMLTGLTAGTYYYSVKDANNFTISDSVVLAEAPIAMGVLINPTNVDCYNKSTGYINLTVTGGGSPYTFNWSNGAITQNIANLITNTYTVCVTDTFGCKIYKSAVITQPNALLVSVSIKNDENNKCIGQATANPIGGTPPYTYLWSDPLAQTTKTADGLCEGLYTVFVKDVNNCQVQWSFNLYNTIVGFVENKDDDKKITIYPNPSKNGQFVIDIRDLNYTKLSLRITNSMGQIILKEQIITTEATQKEIQIPSSSGIYHFNIESEGKPLFQKKLLIVKD